MDYTKLEMPLYKLAFVLLLVTLKLWEGAAILNSYEPQDLDSWFANLSGPLGVLFGQMLSILVLAKVIQLVYKQKEKLQAQLLSDRDKTIDELRAEKKQLLDTIEQMWK